MYRERPVSRMQLHVRDVEEPHHGNRSDGISRDTADEPDEENRNGGRAKEDSIQEKEEEEAYSPQPTARNGSEFHSNLVCSPEAFRSMGLLAAFSDNGEDEEMGRDFESRENVSGTSPHDDGDGSRRISERASGLKRKSLATNSFDPFPGPNFRAEKKPRDVDLFKEYSRNDLKKHKERVWDDRADCSRNYSKNVTMTQKFRQEDDDDDDDDDDEERDEEIAILKSMLYYHSENGVFPSGSKKFRNFVSNVLRVDISEHQLKDQIQRLKNRYKKIVGKRGRRPKFSRTRDREAFQLSEKIWGNAADISEDQSKLSAGKHRKRRRFGEEQNASECSHKGRSSQSAKREEGLKSVVVLPKLLQDKRRRLMQEFELEAQRVKLSWEKMELGLEKLKALYGSLVTNSAHHDYLNSSL